MDVFITGGSGWIGSAVVPELVAGGHRVRGLARSPQSADALRVAGAEPVSGTLDDLDVLRTEAIRADGVIHLGNKHDWADLAGTARTERAAVETFVTALEATDKPLLVAAGTALTPGTLLTEDVPSPHAGPDAPRGGTEALAIESASRGVRAVALRFAPTVHGVGDHGFIALISAAATRHGVAAYVGDGTNRWTAVHRSDAGRLVALALESAPAGCHVHAVAEEAVTSREIAEAIGAARGLPVVSIAPEDAVDHFGFVGLFFAMDLPASSALTRERFGWTPTGPTLAEDIAAGAYPV